MNSHTGNISEISYCNDVISNHDKLHYDNPTQKKMIEYLGAYVYNEADCQKIKKQKSSKYMKKQLRKFNSKFEQFRDHVLISNHQSSFDPQKELSDYSFTAPKRAQKSSNPSKVCHIAGSKKQCKENVNFFEIMSLFATQYSADHASK